MNDFSDFGQCWPGQTANTPAALCASNHQQTQKQQKQQPQWVWKGYSIVSGSSPWMGNKHQCLSSLSWLCPVRSIFPPLYFMTTDGLSPHVPGAWGKCSQPGTQSPGGWEGWECASPLACRAARGGLTWASFGLLPAPAPWDLINKPANWINKQLFLIFFIASWRAIRTCDKLSVTASTAARGKWKY